jgi:TatD DNase family protein
MRFLDIHTHQENSDKQVAAVLNRHGQFDLNGRALCTMGLHPWYMREETVCKEFGILAASSKADDVIAIGECGLDKVCDTPWDLQMHWFQKQIELANQVQKPMIIHCVRAFQEVMDVLEKMGNTQPVVFHGFQKKIELANQLLRFGAYLSFGHHLKNEQVQEVFSAIPLSRVFLETDDADVSIQDVYILAAQCKKLPLEDVKRVIAENTPRVFGSKIQL